MQEIKTICDHCKKELEKIDPGEIHIAKDVHLDTKYTETLRSLGGRPLTDTSFRFTLNGEPFDNLAFCNMGCMVAWFYEREIEKASKEAWEEGYSVAKSGKKKK